eukprot:TRINITY_DN86223_c0_g1_i1.p1 TRINITY_DN86223_c0_g1~~TRINITY_DN86223_c0_g1_i1.p1  ORF type:complete len:439 (-),score=5.28 TRINITY_DN86223_c0_g1_i1:167-1483(-)
MGIKDWCRTCDPDEVFSYTTYKRIVLVDRYLGIIDRCFKVAIIIYIVIYVMAFRGGYLSLSTPAGTARMTLEPGDFSNTTLRSTWKYYCNNTNVPPPPSSQITRFPCVKFCTTGIAFPPPSLGLMNVRTRMSHRNITLGCNLHDIYSCDYPRPEKTTEYTLSPEFSTVFIDHSVRSPDGTFIKEVWEMHGALYDCNGKLVHPFPGAADATEGRSGKYEGSHAVSVRELLQAASGHCGRKQHVDAVAQLETPYYNPNANPANSSGVAYNLRHDGGILVIIISYDNTRWFKFDDVSFRMSARLISTEYKVESRSPDHLTGLPGEHFWETDSHGILLAIVQSGQLGVFDFVTLLIQLTSALTLLAVSRTVVDQLATKVMPHRSLYKPYMYSYTEDFSDLRDAKSKGHHIEIHNTEKTSLVPKNVHVQLRMPGGDGGEGEED